MRLKIINKLCELIKVNNLDYQVLCLDIAEQLLTGQYHHLKENLEYLAQNGVHLSLDNFGGISSTLNHLIDMPIDSIKIDHNLLHSIDEKPRHRALISGIIDLGNKLNLQVIQKGVENAVQDKILRDMGCIYAQGFYYCRPLSIENLLAFVESRS